MSQQRSTAFVVSHTHWDRAWYWTVEETRTELVDLVDDLLALLERNPAFCCFTLDGQMAMVRDYLAVRPTREQQIRALARAGRLRLGPFFVLPDLFIPNGESLIRNLRIGIDEARRVGKPMPVGYLPDPFGHPAQLPQILSGFGIAGVVFARGVGDEGEALGADFWWEAPNGSRVLATHQVGGGYANLDRLTRGSTQATAEEIERAVARITALVAEMRRYCPHGIYLLNNGSDLRPAEHGLPRLLEEVRRLLPALTLRHSDLVAYQRAVRRAIAAGRFAPKVYRGELRGSRYANLLPGVLSARVDLKLRHDACERLLLRWTEPLAAIAAAFCGGRDDRALIERAWRLLLLCQPHDDICGCSIDAVHEDDMNRMARCHQLAARVRDRALRAINGASPDRGPVVINPHPWPLQTVLPAPRALAKRGAPRPSQLHRLTPLYVVRLPPLGSAPLARCAVPVARGQGVTPVRVRESGAALTIDNGLIRARVDRHGSLSLIDLRSGLRFNSVAQLLDEGDAGDTYDFSEPAEQRVITGARPRVRATARGPALGEIDLRYRLSLPIGLQADRSRRDLRRRPVSVTVALQVAAASPLLALRVTIRNTVDEHRLRLLVPTPLQTEEVIAGAPFQLVRRSLHRPDTPGWAQQPAATAPFQDMIALQGGGGGLALLAPGLREYEARPARRGVSLLLTLLRSVRWLSRDDLSTRSGHAGPACEVEGARQRGSTTLRCALLPFEGSIEHSSALRHARIFADPPLCVGTVTSSPGSMTGGEHRAFFQLEPQTVLLTALLPGPGGTVEARLLNLLSGPQRARVSGPWRRGCRLRLDGRASNEKIDLQRVVLGPHEIVTLRLWPARERATSGQPCYNEQR